MKLLTTTIAAVVLVGCGESQLPEPPTAKATDISIHDAAIDGNIEAVKQHLADGVDVNAKDKDGFTPLHDAVGWGHKEVVELFIAKGADVNANHAPIDRFFNGKTPLDLASKDEIADLLRKHGGKTYAELKAEESIHKAAIKGNIEAVKQYLAAGTDVNAKDVNGVTPLYYAAGRGRKEVAELLIAKGADVNVNAKSDRDATPLHGAAFNGHAEIAELLIAAGADVNAKIKSGGRKGQTPLDLAISNDRIKTADLLRKHGGKTGEELKAERK
jgi:ankyrin repeat protein